MYEETHSLLAGYLTWLIGFTGAHRFYYGRPITGTIWFLTLGVFGIGWVVDFFLIPSMRRSCSLKYEAGPLDYSLAWLLLAWLGPFGVHRFYMCKLVTGLCELIITLLVIGSGGLLWIVFFVPLAVLHLNDLWTLNEQITAVNHTLRRTR